jgi:hypothetical protein
MPSKVRERWPEAALTRLLDVFEEELLRAPDEEIMAAARGLGMVPTMKGSAAFLDVKFALAMRDADSQAFAAWRGVPGMGEAPTAGQAKRPRPRKD